jgi:NADP-dependent 3-hydroxy acid dehydrogenase YdfG
MSDPHNPKAGIVVGAAGAIGAAVATELAADGATVYLLDRDQAQLAGVAAGIRDDGACAWAIGADITDAGCLEGACERCAQETGRLDFMIVASGRGEGGPFAHANPAGWEGMVAVNLLGPLLAINAAVVRMRANEAGDIVLVGSLSGRRAYPGEAVYIATKWGLTGAAQAIQAELAGTGIRLSLIQPGLVETPLARSNPLARRWLQEITPLRPADVARAVMGVLRHPGHATISELVIRPSDQRI